MPVKNFLVYYLVDEKKRVMWITAVIYGWRDQIVALLDISLNDGETTAYIVDCNLATKFESIFEQPTKEEIDVWVGE